MNSGYYVSPFLPVQTSFWPVMVSLALFSLIGNFVLFLNLKLSLLLVLVSVVLTVLISFIW